MLRSRQIVKTLYNIAMRKFFKLFLVLCFVFFATQISFAEEFKVLVLPDNIQFESTNYVVYPDSALMFASDIINDIKKDNKVQTVSMTEIRDTLRKNTKLSITTKNALKEFKYNYNIPFVDFKFIANQFSTNKVLIITSQTDVQNYAIRKSIWDWLNVPGAAVVEPAYKMSTYAALIDVDKEQVLWQNTYYKTISSMDNRILAVNFAPATEQLQKIKFYSMYLLAPDVSSKVQSKILPNPILNPDGSCVVNVSNIKTDENVVTIPEDANLKPKMVVPQRENPKSYGIFINDL